MACSALDVAKYVIKHEHDNNREVSNLRLQKLLYFVQAKVLVKTGSPCFDDDIEAWDYGPVVPVVYHKYKIFGSLDIRLLESVPPLGNPTEEYAAAMLDTCKDYPTYQLVDITHSQSPWKKAYRRNMKTVIPQESIRRYFASLGDV